MTLSPSFHLDGGGGGGGGGGGVSSSTCSGATGAAAGGGGGGAAASGSLERGGGASSSVVSPPAVGGFQLAGEAVWGESMFISAQKAARLLFGSVSAVQKPRRYVCCRVRSLAAITAFFYSKQPESKMLLVSTCR